MKAFIISLVMAALMPATHAGPEWMAVSECSKLMKGKSGKDHKIRIGLMTLTEDKASCEVVGNTKAVNMAKEGWNCSVEGVNHFCSQITKAEEDLGLDNVRKREPVSFTYLVFTDMDRHLTQISFWDLPKMVGMQFCEAFRQDVMKAGVTDALCVPGKT